MRMCCHVLQVAIMRENVRELVAASNTLEHFDEQTRPMFDLLDKAARVISPLQPPPLLPLTVFRFCPLSLILFFWSMLMYTNLVHEPSISPLHFFAVWLLVAGGWCVNTHTNIYIYIYIHIQIQKSTYLYVCTYICTYICMYIYPGVYMHVDECVLIYISIYVDIYTYMYYCIHMYKYTQTQA